jgi:hypothetical protein
MITTGSGFGYNDGINYSFDCYYNECSEDMQCYWNIYDYEAFYDNYYICDDSGC